MPVRRKTVTRKKRTPKMIKVLLGELVKPLVTKECAAGTTLEVFLKDNNVVWGANVRVNAETVKPSYKLQTGDVITTIGSVSGGR